MPITTNLRTILKVRYLTLDLVCVNLDSMIDLGLEARGSQAVCLTPSVLVCVCLFVCECVVLYVSISIDHPLIGRPVDRWVKNPPIFSQKKLKSSHGQHLKKPKMSKFAINLTTVFHSH